MHANRPFTSTFLQLNCTRIGTRIANQSGRGGGWRDALELRCWEGKQRTVWPTPTYCTYLLVVYTTFAFTFLLFSNFQTGCHLMAYNVVGIFPWNCTLSNAKYKLVLGYFYFMKAHNSASMNICLTLQIMWHDVFTRSWFIIYFFVVPWS